MISKSKQDVTQHAVTAKDAGIVSAMRPQVAPMKGQMNGPAARPAYDHIIEQTPDAAGVTYESAIVGGVRGVWCRPPIARDGVVLLYVHGGAYVLGTANAYRHFAGQIAARTNTAAFVADYRLAPENVFPAAVDDVRAVYRGLAEQGAQRILIAGDSAGGGLALVLLASAQAESLAGRGVAPTAGIVFSPWTDLALTGTSLRERAEEELFLTYDTLDAARLMYLGARDAHDPLASPLYGGLAGLPPIQLHVGTSEVILDDTLRYAEKARAAGVDATTHVWEGMPHVFVTSVGVFDAADEALGLVAGFAEETIRA